MGRAVTIAGRRVTLSGARLELPGWADTFDRADVRVGGPWRDFAYSGYRNSFTPATLDEDGNNLSLVGESVNTYDGSNWVILGHYLLWRTLPVSTNVEVGIEWETPAILSTLHQPSPLLLFDPDASVTEFGLAPIWDVSLAAYGIQNAFATVKESNTFDSSFYRVLGTDGEMHAVGDIPVGSLYLGQPLPSYGAGESHTIAARLVGTEIAMYLDGDLILGPWSIPAEYRGRRRFGVTVIAICVRPGYALQNGDVFQVPAQPSSDEMTPCVVSRWWATPVSAF